MVTRTEIKYSNVAVVIAVPILGIGLSVWIIYLWTDPDISGFMKFFGFPMVTIATLIALIIEFPKLKSLEIHKDKIVFKNLLTRQTQEIKNDTFDGFKTMSQWTKYGIVYEIILVIDGRQFHDISSNYIQNYDRIRTALGKQIVNLGTEKFRYFKYLRERLKI